MIVINDKVAYCGAEFITAINIFIAHTNGVKLIKLFSILFEILDHFKIVHKFISRT